MCFIKQIVPVASGILPRNLVREGWEVVQQIHLMTVGRENKGLGAVDPSKGFRSVCK
jgi:hypothetical protein